MTKVLDANVPMDAWRRMAWLGSQNKLAEAFQSLRFFAAILQPCEDSEAD